MDDIGYFLSKPGLLSRVPQLLLVSKKADLDWKCVTASDLLGAVLLYKCVVLGCGIGIFTTNDRSGRGTLVAPAALRSNIAALASQWLLNHGGLAVMLSFRADATVESEIDLDNDLSNSPQGSRKTMRWARREGDVIEYLPLESTFDATLAKIGQRTRRNMRHYRRQAEEQLGCAFFSTVDIGKSEFLKFNLECMYAVPAGVAAWRYDSRKSLSKPLLMGIKDKDGRWLSLLGGRRRCDGTEILWQMNRSDLSAYSLSLVMRSYFIEHEISHGMSRLYVEGGTGHPMRFSFVKEKVSNLVVLRRSLLGSLVPRMAKRFVKLDNELAVMLLDKSLEWRVSAKDLPIRVCENTST